MLTAEDELRHEYNDDVNWRESVYFNFADASNQIGGWIYLWVLPNQELKSGMLCSFYHGLHPDADMLARAAASPGHVANSEDGGWMYYVTRNVPELISADFDDVELFGLRIRRVEALKSYHLEFRDDFGNGFDLSCKFLTPPYDYADHPNPTPAWMAANRYHRSWRCEGTLRIAGKEFVVRTTGDSDHSWGRRDREEFGKNLFKMWSAQLGEDFSFSVVTMGDAGVETPYGFLARDGAVHPVVAVSQTANYGQDGLQRIVAIELTDDEGVVVRATAEMFASIRVGGASQYWGNEGGATYDIDGRGLATGVVSYFWPATVAPQSLRA